MIIARNIIVAVPNLAQHSQTAIFTETFTFARFGMNIIGMHWLLQVVPFLAQCQARGLITVPGMLSPTDNTATHPARVVRNLAKVKLSLKLDYLRILPLVRRL